jgi:hypothetical protein
MLTSNDSKHDGMYIECTLNVHWMYIECDAAHRTVRPSVAAVLWKRPPRWPVAGRSAGHRPQAMLRAAMCRCSVISEDFQATWLRFFGCEMVVNLLCQSSIRQRCGPQIRIAQNTSKTEIRKDRSTAKSCYVMLCLCGPLHITCTLWDACHTCHACVACSVWLTKFWTGQGQDIQVVEDLEEPGSLKASCNDHAMWRSRSKKLWPSLTNGKWNWVVPVVNANNVSIDVSRIQ